VIKIVWDDGFKKAYKTKIKENKFIKEKFWESIELFSENPFNIKLKTHKLTGKLKGLWAISTTYDLRIIFKFLNEKEILLIDIGNHDEVY
jgi:addiction module RelE/StbE family toxin